MKSALAGVVAAIILGAAAYAFSGTAVTVAGKAESHTAADGLQEQQVAQRIHQLVNEERSRHGLPPLSWDGRIATFAQAHSRDVMAKGNYADSPGPQDKGDIFYRAIENAICVKEMNQQLVSIEGRTQEEIARLVVGDWLQNDYSRGNLLGPHGKEGIGVAFGPESGIVTQDLC